MRRKATTRTFLLTVAAGVAALLTSGGCSYTPRDAFYDSRKVVFSSRPGTGDRVSLSSVQTLTDARER